MADKSDKEKKMERIKNRLLKLQEKFQDRVEDIQDQFQMKIEKSKLGRFVTHLSDDKSSENSLDDKDDKVSLISSDSVFKEVKSDSVPSVVINGSIDVYQDPKEVCKEFLSIEKNVVTFKRRSLSATNLSYGGTSIDYDSSSDSCFSCVSSNDERYVITL